MKYFFKFILLTLLTFSVCHAQAADPKIAELTQKKIPDIIEPPIDIKTLPNGIKLYYLRDSELPVFKMTSYFEWGTLYETKAERGLSSFFMSALRSGGTLTRKPEELDEELDFMATSIATTAGSDLSHMQLLCQQKDMQKGLALYFDLLLRPGFEESRLEVIRTKFLDGMNRRNEDPSQIVMREFLQSLFGEESVYAWLSTPETINAITKETLIKYHKEHVAPNRTWIAASSPLKFEEFLKVLDPFIKDWTVQLPAPKRPAPMQKEWQASIELIDKPGNQSSVVLGHFGERRFNKDKYKIILADEILGGTTFGSRLGDRIRTELGLAYSIQSLFSFEDDYGPFRIATKTKSESTLKTIDEIKKILIGFVKEQNITQEELDLARERIINRLVFEFDVPFNIVAKRLNYDYKGYPPGYLTHYQNEISKVTLKDVKEILADYFFPDKLKIMIVGQRDAIPGIDQVPGLKMRPLDNE